MLTLNPNESRVLGVLIEKAQTTPQQYPLTLNALLNGANQKNNRDPVTNLNEDQVLEAVDSLRGKGLLREVMLSGSRVQKFRHVAREVLEIDTNQLVILAELLLRGPQTVGELRGRASRMSASLETTDIVKNILDSLRNHAAGPMVQELPPAPGDRAARYAQLLCPTLHPLDAPAQPARSVSATAACSAMPAANDSEFVQRIERLEAEVAHLRNSVKRLAESLGDSEIITAID